MKRRQFLAAAAAGACLPSLAPAQPRRVVTDATGRRIEVPGRVERIYAAGPPASILVFAVAPDKLIGWTSAWREAERPFIARKYVDLPALGRLTGRGNTANVEVVLREKPDVIVDYGTVNPTFASLAERVQQQTGIPYLLLDGDFNKMADAVTRIGAIAGAAQRAEEWARYIRETLAFINQLLAGVPRERRPRVYYGRGPLGLTTGRAGSINVESIEQLGATNVAAAHIRQWRCAGRRSRCGRDTPRAPRAFPRLVHQAADRESAAAATATRAHVPAGRAGEKPSPAKPLVPRRTRFHECRMFRTGRGRRHSPPPGARVLPAA